MSAKIKARLKKLLSQEKGAMGRDWGARWPVALIYPQIYPVAMGNLGLQASYRLLNDTSGLHCERAFLPAPEDWEEYRRTRTPILSLKSQPVGRESEAHPAIRVARRFPAPWLSPYSGHPSILFWKFLSP